MNADLRGFFVVQGDDGSNTQDDDAKEDQVGREGLRVEGDEGDPINDDSR